MSWKASCVVLSCSSRHPLVWLMLCHLLTWWDCNEEGVYWCISDSIKTLLLYSFPSSSSTCFADVFLFIWFNFCQGSCSLYPVWLKLFLCFKLIVARPENWVVEWPSVAEDSACPIYCLCVCFLSCKWAVGQCNSCNDLQWMCACRGATYRDCVQANIGIYFAW